MFKLQNKHLLQFIVAYFIRYFPGLSFSLWSWHSIFKIIYKIYSNILCILYIVHRWYFEKAIFSPTLVVLWCLAPMAPGLTRDPVTPVTITPGHGQSEDWVRVHQSEGLVSPILANERRERRRVTSDSSDELMCVISLLSPNHQERGGKNFLDHQRLSQILSQSHNDMQCWWQNVLRVAINFLILVLMNFAWKLNEAPSN